MSWARMGAIVTALVALVGLMAFVGPFLQSDSPPLAGVSRVDGVQTSLTKTIQNDADRIEARIVGVSIVGMWRAVCDAQRARNRDLAQSYDAQLSDLQIEYMRLTGLNYPLRPCL